MNTDRIADALTAQGVEAVTKADEAFAGGDAQSEAFQNGAQDATAKALALVLETDPATAMERILLAATDDDED